jgi:uncharacterized protein YoxC
METSAMVYIALLLNALAVLVLLYLAYKAEKILGEFAPYMRDVEQMRDAITRRGNDILTRTITVAQEIIRNAIAASQKNLRASESFQDELGKLLKEGTEQNLSESKKIIQNATKDIVDAYQKQFSILAREVEASGRFAHNQLLEATKKRSDELSSGWQTELVRIRQEMEEKLLKGMQEAQSSAKMYQEEKIKELDSKIYQILSQVAKKTLGRSIDLSTHEELVMEALEKAKKENLF